MGVHEDIENFERSYERGLKDWQTDFRLEAAVGNSHHR